MMSVYEYQENLKEQKKVKELETSTAEVIKREVVHQQMDAQVRVTQMFSGSVCYYIYPRKKSSSFEMANNF
jgi:hypothetical protein